MSDVEGDEKMASEKDVKDSKATPYMYVVTAQKPTATTVAITSNFTGPDDLNLILAKNSKIEIHTISPEGLRHYMDLNINGCVTCMQSFRPKGEDQDVVFVLTRRYHVFIIQYKPATKELITRTYGDIEDSTGKPTDIGAIGIVDPECKLIGLRLYEGLLKIVPLDTVKQKEGKELKSFNIRIEELNIIDIKFLEGCKAPTIVYIYQTQKGTRHVKTFEISLSNKEFTKGPWKLTNVEANANLIIPVKGPLYGAIIIGLATVSYCKADTFISHAPGVLRDSIITSYCTIDSKRYLCSDDKGLLFILTLVTDHTDVVTDIQMILLGETTIASCLAYLDNSVVYVGSAQGDSQLIHINPGRTSNDELHLTVLETYANLGSITDMCIVDSDKQPQLVTCSGSSKEGSLRVVRCGIGIQELASIDIPGIKGIWPIRIRSDDALDNALIITFMGYTRILYFDGEEVEEIETKDLISDKQTLYSGMTSGDNIIQICSNCIRLLDSHTLQTVSEWKPATGERIDHVGCNKTQCVVSDGNVITYLSIEGGHIKQISRVELDHDVACVDITPLVLMEKSDVSKYCAVGCWVDGSIRVYSLPDFQQLQTHELGGEIVVKSILMCPFEDSSYLMATLGDGSLFYCDIDPETGKLSKKKKIALGIHSTTLQLFHAFDANHVFASSDRPTVIYSNSNKLVFSTVNMQDVNHMCPLNTGAYPDALALASSSGLIVGSVAAIQKLHIQTIPLGESPKRIAYQEATSTYGIITMRNSNITASSVSTLCQNITDSSDVINGMDPDSRLKKDAANNSEVHNLLIMDKKTYEVLHVHRFAPTEWGLSVFSYHCNDKDYFVVGTAFVNEEDSESKDGRVIVFRWDGTTLNQVASHDVKGAVSCVTEVCGKILAGINNKVTVFEFKEEDGLKVECKYHNTLMAVYLRSRGQFILVGDLLRSMALLVYKQLEGRLEDIAKDYKANWMTQVEILDDDTFLGAEHFNNLFVCTKEGGMEEEDRRLLKLAGQFHLGENANVFREGSLVLKNPSGAPPLVHKTILYGSSTGAIGLIGCIEKPLFDLLLTLQEALARTVTSIGCIPHNVWRGFHNDRQKEPAKGFIDGDLIERFLDLPRSEMTKICVDLFYDFDGTGMKREGTVDDLVKLIEDLARIH